MLENLYVKYQVALLEQGIDEKIVRGAGPFGCSVALVGEAPGGEEEKTGKPFVGAAGKKLTGFLELIEVSRDDVYITNVVKFRPKKISPKTGNAINRPPTKEEIELSAPFLFEELKLVNPKVIVTMGNVALKAITGDFAIRIGSYHGKILEISGLQIFPMYHPASVIYNQELNRVYEEDLEKLKGVLETGD